MNSRSQSVTRRSFRLEGKIPPKYNLEDSDDDDDNESNQVDLSNCSIKTINATLAVPSHPPGPSLRPRLKKILEVPTPGSSRSLSLPEQSIASIVNGDGGSPLSIVNTKRGARSKSNATNKRKRAVSKESSSSSITAPIAPAGPKKAKKNQRTTSQQPQDDDQEPADNVPEARTPGRTTSTTGSSIIITKDAASSVITTKHVSGSSVIVELANAQGPHVIAINMGEDTVNIKSGVRAPSGNASENTIASTSAQARATAETQTKSYVNKRIQTEISMEDSMLQCDGAASGSGNVDSFNDSNGNLDADIIDAPGGIGDDHGYHNVDNVRDIDQINDETEELDDLARDRELSPQQRSCCIQ